MRTSSMEQRRRFSSQRIAEEVVPLDWAPRAVRTFEVDCLRDRVGAYEFKGPHRAWWSRVNGESGSVWGKFSASLQPAKDLGADTWPAAQARVARAFSPLRQGV
jgi:hypothetical protein